LASTDGGIKIEKSHLLPDFDLRIETGMDGKIEVKEIRWRRRRSPNSRRAGSEQLCRAAQRDQRPHAVLGDLHSGFTKDAGFLRGEGAAVARLPRVAPIRSSGLGHFPGASREIPRKHDTHRR